MRQLVERGDSVPAVSDRLGMSAHSLYKWVKAVKSDNSWRQAAELIEPKSAALNLRTDLWLTDEERDILKEAVGYFASQLE